MAGWGGEDMIPFLVNAGYYSKGGMVLVQVNYRVNMLGFLSMQQLSSISAKGVSGNYGIQDQLLALQWVQQNIKAFGGDPSCVTIAGQSSGGTSVFALMASPLSKGLFTAGISLSGSCRVSCAPLQMPRPAR
jgi:para-nitrobenzyl esterase